MGGSANDVRAPARQKVVETPRLSEERIRELVAAARVATLATIGSDGRPDLVPFTFVLDGNVLYSAVDRKPKGTAQLRRLANIERDPRVSVLVSDYNDDWSRLSWCRLDGVATVRRSAIDHPLDLLAAKYEQYRHKRPQGPVVEITTDSWMGWAAVG